MKITDASVFDFSSCQRLANNENAGIMIRFKDLQQRNNWLQNAKCLKNHAINISFAPDFPPVLRPLKKELLEKRKNLSATEKKGAIIKNLRQWPYVELKLVNGPVIRPSVKAEDVVHSVLGFHPMMRIHDVQSTSLCRLFSPYDIIDLFILRDAILKLSPIMFSRAFEWPFSIVFICLWDILKSMLCTTFRIAQFH